MKLRFLLSPAAVLLASDCIAVFACCVLAFVLRFITPGSAMTVSIYVSVLPWMLVFPLLYFILFTSSSDSIPIHFRSSLRN